MGGCQESNPGQHDAKHEPFHHAASPKDVFYPAVVNAGLSRTSASVKIALANVGSASEA